MVGRAPTVLRCLDLYHTRAGIREQARGGGAGDLAREIEAPHSLEWIHAAFHSPSPIPGFRRPSSGASRGRGPGVVRPR